MKLILSISFIMLLNAIAIAQIVYERSDYISAGDAFPVVRYTNITEQEGLPIGLFETEGVFTIAENTGFVNCLEDTIRFYVPSDLDTDGMFVNADCAYINEMGFTVFMIIDEDKAINVGMQGILPVADMPVSMAATDSMNIILFPSLIGSQNIDEGSMDQNFLITDFESIIPEEYYDMVVAMYDSVKISVVTSKDSHFEDECLLIVNDTNAFKATRDVLCEFCTEISIMDILMRSKFSGSWQSISTVPGIGDQLPMELPVVDTAITLNYWANGYGIPLLSVATNADRDSVFSLTVYNVENTAIQTIEDNFKVLVYPNPTNGLLNFDFAHTEQGVLSIFDELGKLVEEVVFSSKNITFDAAKLDAGFYIYRIQTQSGNNNKGKIQVLR